MTVPLNQLVQGMIADPRDVPTVPIEKICLHSKDVKPGDLYIAIHGSSMDGHDFIPDALANGASAVITNGRDVGTFPVPQIKVSNPRKAASYIAAKFYGHPSRHLHVIGITGTNGKTTTATLIHSILKESGFKTAQLGTLGVIAEGHRQGKTLTTLDPVNLQKLFRELVDDHFTHIVMEVSSHAIHQYRVADVEFDTTIFTNLSPEHLDYHGSMEDYFYAKSKLFTSLPLSATAIINIDNEYGRRLVNKSTAPVLKISITSPGDIWFKTVESTLSGIKGVISAGEHEFQIESSLIGDFNRENILSAAGAAISMGIPKNTIRSGIYQCQVITGRMESFTAPNGARIVVDYAHTPDAYEKVLGTVYELCKENGEMIVLFGCGGNRDASNRPTMGRLVEQFANYFYITPDNPRDENPDHIVQDIVAGLSSNKYEICSSRQDGLEKALSLLQKNDVLVVLGKGRESYQEIKGIRHPYSDIKIIEVFCENSNR